MDAKKQLNSKIIKVTAKIRADHPELSKYLDEMPAPLPKEKDGDVSLDQLNEYFNSLNSLLTKYIEEQEVKKAEDPENTTDV